MQITMIIPSYWGRKKEEKRRETDTIYDHPTALDDEGTLRRLLESLSILTKREFRVVVLAVPTAEDIQSEVEQKVSTIIKEKADDIETQLFSYSHLAKIHQFLTKNNKADLMPLLKLNGYSNVRNLCIFVPHLLGSEIAVLIDDDEIFEDPSFMDKALELIGKEEHGERVLAVAGYYINPDDDFLLNREISPWMTYWNKIACMNRAFKEFIAKGPRFKVTPFAFGGNLVIHRDLFTRIPFDPSVPRGEDIDFLINARMFGFKTYLDNQLSIKHDAPPKISPTWERLREDIFRFVFEKRKLEGQKGYPGIHPLQAADLDPYPGEFLKDDLEEKIFRSNQMLATDYIAKGDSTGAIECMRNIYLAHTKAIPDDNPYYKLLRLQTDWEKLMDFFSADKVADGAIALSGLKR
ncbi:MAG: hypothetical protein OEY18_09495 [Candidatus Aminicenantes bacterium]|nr:hypothetical protein [Candidatus Aminicenantes bacterium]MDH5384929.1 hypothetical protein [Candidatus Aminicenantes bacterium]MDH5743198.1 hypothetical protein [Candidatus Aminicenantes bacterium]